MNGKYSWKQMPEEYNASYYNDKDYKEGRKFTIVDNTTGNEYVYPKIETRQGAGGQIFDQRIMEPALWNEEFMRWAICTSEDFINYVGSEWLTPSVMDYIVDNFQFPMIFSVSFNNELRDHMTRNLWIKAFENNNEVARYIPREFMTSDMVKTLADLKNVSLYNINTSYLTSELFEKIYFNSDKEHKLNIFSITPKYTESGEDISKLVTKKIADDILSIDIRTIWNIPAQFISQKDATKAMETDIKLLEYVPAEYQTLDCQKKLIDKNPSYISLINPVALLDETIYYALNKKGSVLASVPIERRTFEVCDYAVRTYAGALKSVPDGIKTPQMCFNAVVKDPSMIKYVPVDILNSEFIEMLNAVGVDIPVKFHSYIESCLEANRKLEGETINLDRSNTIKLNFSSGYPGIKIETLGGLLSETNISFLKKHGVMTIEDLLQKSQNRDLYKMILDENVSGYKEIDVAIKLIKCKYLDVDPMIEFDPEKTMEETAVDFGFSTRVKKCLMKKIYTQKEFLDILGDKHKEEKLLDIKNMGEKGVKEVIVKSSIILDYYDRHKNIDERKAKEEELKTLYEELDQVQAEIRRIEERSDELLFKLQEKLHAILKGGI